MKTLKILFAFVIIVVLNSGLIAQTSTPPSIGDGTSGDPWQIATLNNLYWLTQTTSEWASGKYFIQTADINATTTSSWHSGAGFSPIGNGVIKFTGSYDGDGFTISNLYINRPLTDRIGLFGYVGDGGTLSRILLQNVNITGDQLTGSLVGGAQGTTSENTVNIQQCGSSGDVVGASQTGGFIGQYLDYVNIEQCYTHCDVVQTTPYYAGGFIGETDNVPYPGRGIILNCYSHGNVTSTSTVAGGFMGRGHVARITNSYCTGSVYHSDGDDPTDHGFIASWGNGFFSNNFWDSEASNQTDCGIHGTPNYEATGKTTAEMKTQSTFTDAGWDFTSIWEIVGTNYPRLINVEDTSLPVELTSFTADNTRAGEITLNWVTESEIENLGFLLERRNVETQDLASPWLEIASYVTDESLRGQGSVTYRTEYSYTDKTVDAAGETYDYRLADVSYAGEKVYHALTVLGVEVIELPTEFALLPAYPNPFNPETVIRYQLSADSNVLLQVYDVSGRLVTTLVNKPQHAGRCSIEWNASNYASGEYLCKLTIGDHSITQKLTLIK